VRDGEHPLRTAVEAWRARGRTTPEGAAEDPLLVEAQAGAQRDLLAAQQAAGVDLPGDGYVPVYDEWFAWAGAVGGVEVGPSIRYLDTNTYYHRWHLRGRPARLGPGPAVRACRAAVALAEGPVKACLFGPLTLWEYALKEEGAGDEAAFDALTDVCAAEVADLAGAGAAYVQLEESVVLRPRHRAAFPLLERALGRIARDAPDARVVLHLAGGVVSDLIDQVLETPVAGVGLDLTGAYREPNLAALGRWHGDKLFQAGVADAREIRLEAEDALRETLGAVTALVPAGRCLAAPSTALLHLPRHAAFEKLAGLARVAHAMGDGE
jgi:5-methyltetrahydropteroyltriglutamate--homocysteine methyltransferase